MWVCIVYDRYGHVQEPPCDPTRTQKDSPGLHQTPSHLSRDPMRALKDPLNPTKAVHGAIMGSEKHDFLTLRKTFRLCWRLRQLP